MRDALYAEWTKLRTLTSTGWLLSAAAVLTVGLSAAVVGATGYTSGGPYQDLPKLALTGIDLGQSVIAVLAVLAVSNEYSTGMMRTTLAAVPRRLVVLAAKAVNLVGLTVVAGIVAVGACLFAARLILPGRGFTAAHGYPVLALAHGPIVRAAVGSVLYLVLIALFSLGVATAVRDSATAIGLVLGLLYLFPLLAQLVTGLAIQATTNLQGLPISPWAGLAVLAAWAGAALIGGGVLLRHRDA